MSLFEGFHYYWTEIADPRTSNWSLIYSIYQTPLIVITYLYVVFYLAPRFMKNRPPYSLKTFIKLYNAFQIIVNAWLVQEHIAAGWMKNIPLTCIPITYSYEPRYYKHAEILWWVLLLKIIDFTETMIFILRKKDKQVSGLHLYHHVSTVLIVWMAIKYYPSEMTTFPTLINCSVHVLMYTYYLLIVLGPHTQAIALQIKQYITIIQMVQFFGLIMYALQIMLPNCRDSTVTIMAVIFLIDVMINWFLFYKFYKKEYVSSKMKM